MDGDYYERELVNQLRGDGYAVLRTGASGGGTSADLPDVSVLDRLNYVMECKACSDDYIYLDGEEVEALLRFARAGAALALIGVRFSREAWHFTPPLDCHRTPTGRYRVHRDDLSEPWVEDYDSVFGSGGSTS